MSQLILAVVLVSGILLTVVVGIALARPGLLRSLVSTAAAQRAERLPYRPCDSLLTPTEQAFYVALREAAGSMYGIAPKVRLADVLTCDREAWNKGYGNKILSKHLDFVLYDPESTRIRAGIELDDRSHRRQDRQSRDRFLDDAMAAAGVPLIRFPASRNYSAPQISEALVSRVTPPSRPADARSRRRVQS